MKILAAMFPWREAGDGGYNSFVMTEHQQILHCAVFPHEGSWFGYADGSSVEPSATVEEAKALVEGKVARLCDLRKIERDKALTW